MSRLRQNRSRRPLRAAEPKDSKPIIRIITEGEATEPEYFEEFRNTYKNPRVTVEIVPGKAVPKTLVERAKQIKRASASLNSEYDSVWCVFDVDEHPHIDDAKQTARVNDIHLAISNPCFELWLLLHFHSRRNIGCKSRHDLQKLLEKDLPGYTRKSKHIQFKNINNGTTSSYEKAVEHAKRLEKCAGGDDPSKVNPTTGVYKLTELIRGAPESEHEGEPTSPQPRAPRTKSRPRQADFTAFR